MIRLVLLVEALCCIFNTQSASAFSKEEVRCVALNVYHEARGEIIPNQIAVAFVTLNRARDERWPSTPCSVVRDAVRDAQNNPILHKCQFSWYCDGRSDVPKEKKAWLKSMKIARRAHKWKMRDPSKGAVMFHANCVRPSWARQFKKTAVLGNHIFYH